MKILFHTLIFVLFISCSHKTELRKETSTIITSEYIASKIDSNSSIKRSADISDPLNQLTEKKEDLELNYIVWGCACAPWVKTENLKAIPLADSCMFIEPSDSTLSLNDSFDPFKHKIIVHGQFYLKADYPKGTPEMEEPIQKAPVFRYDQIQIVDK